MHCLCIVYALLMHNHSDTGAAVPAPDSEVWKKGFAVNWAQQEREMSDALGAYTNEGSDTDAVVDPEDDDDEDEDEAGGAGPEESSSASTTQVSGCDVTSERETVSSSSLSDRRCSRQSGMMSSLAIKYLNCHMHCICMFYALGMH